MVITCRQAAVAVLAGVVAAAGVAGVLNSGGCAAKRRAREWAVVSRTYAKTSFVNQSSRPVRVQVVVGERSDAPPGMGSSFVGQPQVIAPGGTYMALVQETKPYGVGFLFPDNQLLVVRFKVESAGATWEPVSAAWYEVVGALPEMIRITDDGEGGAPGAAADAGRIERVPRDWWPAE